MNNIMWQYMKNPDRDEVAKLLRGTHLLYLTGASRPRALALAMAPIPPI